MGYDKFLCPGLLPDAGCAAPKRAGDRVMIGRNRGPIYRVIHIAGDTAWLGIADRAGADVLVPVANLRVVKGEAPRLAA